LLKKKIRKKKKEKTKIKTKEDNLFRIKKSRKKQQKNIVNFIFSRVLSDRTEENLKSKKQKI
jgi:hypothetical protein